MNEERTDLEVLNDILANIGMNEKPELSDYEWLLVTDILLQAKESMTD